MSNLILGIDAGNHMAKVAGEYGIDSYRTAICEWFERDVVEIHGADDMEFEIDGRKGFAGTIAVYEDEFGGGSMFGDSKAHEDTKIRVLLAIHRYIEKYSPGIENVSLVTGQPISSHKDAEKKKIIEMLKGTHELIVNKEWRRIHIHDVAVGAEGSGAYWATSGIRSARIIDVGSGTVNCATIADKRYINNASDTFNFGMETVNNKNDLASIARGIIRGTTKLKWDKNDIVLICGGISKDILPFIAKYYVSARLLEPLLKNRGDVIFADPVFANAIGFYNLARMTFK
ncbi:ParM/StbA family protein [Sporosarcina jiandibaonis]|uniref:ParM/StbA family protein n=1 Tax=Sporosarcina jiandibaonis TaxID=2715535 RepID=UPI001551669D|nr:hypothetical protein [Sporosarcina jiandibaonis]